MSASENANRPNFNQAGVSMPNRCPQRDQDSISESLLARSFNANQSIM